MAHLKRILNVLNSRSKDCSDERHMIAGDSGATMLKINSHKMSKLESCMQSLIFIGACKSCMWSLIVIGTNNQVRTQNK